MDGEYDKDIGKILSDIEWLKKEFTEIKELVKESNDKMEKIIDDLEERVKSLEEFRDKVKGAILVVATLFSGGAVVYILARILGG